MDYGGRERGYVDRNHFQIKMELYLISEGYKNLMKNSTTSGDNGHI